METRNMRNKHRKNKGAALVEGVVSLAMVIGGVILGVLLLVNVGVSMYYKQKLGIVSNHAAQFAATQDPGDPNLQFNTLMKARAIATAMGLPPVNITTIDLSNPDFVTVTVNMSGVLIGKGDVIPSAVNISDTASASKSASPIGYFVFGINMGVNSGRRGWVPIYRQSAPGLPSWRLEIGLAGAGTSQFNPATDGPTNFLP
jgi:hypothetical protein